MIEKECGDFKIDFNLLKVLLVPFNAMAPLLAIGFEGAFWVYFGYRPFTAKLPVQKKQVCRWKWLSL